MNTIALTLSDQGKWEDAATFQQKVQEASIRLLGTEHPETLRAMNNLAFTLRALGTETSPQHSPLLGDSHLIISELRGEIFFSWTHVRTL